MSLVVAQLRDMADQLEKLGTSTIGPWPLFVYVVKFETAKLTFRCQCHPLYVRAKADNIIKTARKVGNGLTESAKECLRYRNSKPSKRRARYSERVARDFILDGEIDNHTTYQELYGRS